MNSLLYKCSDFLWDGVQNVEYKKDEGPQTFRNVDRQNIINKREDISFDVRYFECGIDGFTTLEKHEHTHIVLVLRGSGLVLIESEWHEVKPFDCFVIPGNATHQLKNVSKTEPFGFICIVDKIRDPYRLLTSNELGSLLENLKVSEQLEIPLGYIH